MEQTKSLTAPIPASLHARVTVARIAANQSLGAYMTELLTNYYNNGGKHNMAKTRTLAFQIDEELFQRIKRHLERESGRAGRKLTQRDFVIGLIEDVLRQAEAAEENAAPRTVASEAEEEGEQDDAG